MIRFDSVRAVDDCRVSQLVLLDLSAAFDTMDHQVLLCVLSGRFGISGTALNWFESYLSYRTQSFVYTGHTTAYFPVTCSVPQVRISYRFEIYYYYYYSLLRQIKAAHKYSEHRQLKYKTSIQI